LGRALDENRLAGGARDLGDLFGRTLELGVRQYGSALERKFALQLDPGLGGGVLVLTFTVTGRGMR